ncbi:MAG: abhydrolase domain-containing 18 [Acidobacteria bacterium]|nr:abhydrolase domain-containing 18 [Acidobacteriota bacterium]
MLHYRPLTREGRLLSAIFYRWEKWLSQRDTNRKVRDFEWGLEFVQDGAAAGDPKEFLLEHARKALADSDRYHGYSPAADAHLQGRHLTFTSPVRSPYPKNNTVHALYFPVQSGGRAVVVLPQWNSDLRGHQALCRMLNYFGLSALRVSLPYHDLRMPDELERADYMLSPNLGRTLQAVRQAVIDARAALDWLQGQGYTRFAILGTSLGSCAALIVMAHDSRLSLSVQNHVSPYFADVVWEGISTQHVRRGLEGNVTLEELRDIWMPISPKAYFKRLEGTGQRSLLVHALYDYSFLPRLSRDVLQDYRKYDIPNETCALRCGHYTSGVFPFNIYLGLTMCRYIRKNL